MPTRILTRRRIWLPPPTHTYAVTYPSAPPYDSLHLTDNVKWHVWATLRKFLAFQTHFFLMFWEIVGSSILYSRECGFSGRHRTFGRPSGQPQIDYMVYNSIQYFYGGRKVSTKCEKREQAEWMMDTRSLEFSLLFLFRFLFYIFSSLMILPSASSTSSPSN